MPTLIVTSWHDAFPDSVEMTCVPVSDAEAQAVNERGAPALSPETLAKLPPCSSWLSIGFEAGMKVATHAPAGALR